VAAHDAIVIGAGINGMAAAMRLAAAGRRVLLVEAAAAPGGAMAYAHLTPGLDPRLAAAAGPEAAQAAGQPVATTVLSADGRHLTVRGGAVEGDVAAGEAQAFATLHARLTAFAGALAPFRAMPPPRLARGAGNAWVRLARAGVGLRALGRDEFREFLRLVLTNVADVAEDELGDHRLRGLLAFDATLGAWAGPRSPNTLILWLNRLAMGAAPLRPAAGTSALALALATALVRRGVMLRCGARVERLLVEGDRVAGVMLAGGEALRAPLVLSTLPPQVTLTGMAGARHLDAGMQARLAHVRARGGTAHLALTLGALPGFRGADLAHRLVIAPSVDAVERAFNPVKYGRTPDRPVMEIVVHPGADTVRLTALVQWAPHAPRDGADAARAALLAAALEVIEAHAPGLRRTLLDAVLTLPGDIAAATGSPGGNWHQAELSVEQMLFLRPLRELAQYEAPLAGLWLGGAAMHPGGWVTGSAGWNAAGRALGAGA
jgi:phytoene dehydrogenase-like protein